MGMLTKKQARLAEAARLVRDASGNNDTRRREVNSRLMSRLEILFSKDPEAASAFVESRGLSMGFDKGIIKSLIAQVTG